MRTVVVTFGSLGRRAAPLSSSLCALNLLVLLSAGHSLNYPLQYLQKHLSNLSGRVRLQQAGGQKAREATPVSSPSSEQFNIVARAIYETVRPEQVMPLHGIYGLPIWT